MSEERKTRVRTDGKVAMTIRVTPEAHRLLLALKGRLGVPMAGLLELLVRQKAREEGVE